MEENTFGDNVMAVNNTDYMFAYKFEIPISRKAFENNKAVSTIPYIGLQLFYDNKSYTLHEDDYDNLISRIYDIKSKSNLFLIQITPSIKHFYKYFYWDLSMNINLLGYVKGHLDYHDYTNYMAINMYRDNAKSNTDYNKILTPTKLFNDWYFIHNISFKVEYMF